ncbi:SDR family oxidoreductase [Ruminococcus sp.]|uniref:SDR family oxidoreductase n=1 Tax=Ruminococcus sp. TaxID=41978 RepID=UPI0025FFFDC3|nr:SDR family oxidoreductase [Ruminococcus sp.]
MRFNLFFYHSGGQRGIRIFIKAIAYALSKNFAVWYAKKSAFELGSRGIRVCSLSPGLIATDMGELEKGEGASMLKYTAEKRMGTPEELGFAIAMAADERNGYLACVDILVDGGSVNGKEYKSKA